MFTTCFAAPQVAKKNQTFYCAGQWFSTSASHSTLLPPCYFIVHNHLVTPGNSCDRVDKQCTTTVCHPPVEPLNVHLMSFLAKWRVETKTSQTDTLFRRSFLGSVEQKHNSNKDGDKHFHLSKRSLPSCEASDKHTEQIRKQLIYFTTLWILATFMFTHWHLLHIQAGDGVHFDLIGPPGTCALHNALPADWPSHLAPPEPIRALITITLIRFQPVIGPQRLIKAMHCFFKLGFHLKYYIIF